MAEQKLPKLTTRVRFPSPAPSSLPPPDSRVAERLMAWQVRHGRHDLPWQAIGDPYGIWVSEIMLQQTQVGAVIPYYQRFMARFPDVATLAAADENTVLQHWSGLGYYARARNLHRAARQVVADGQGAFPDSAVAWCALPGVGRSTAAAIVVFAYGQVQAILDGNVKRVLTRLYALAGDLRAPAFEQRLWRLAEQLLPETGIATYTQGLMDLGATVCTRRQPRCQACPLQEICLAFQAGNVQAYPTPRPPRVLPERSTQMLLVQQQGLLLLEKRPARGIWGGLWSFPETAVGEDPAAWLLQHQGLRGQVAESLPLLRHGFTHYRLNIHPVCVSVTGKTAGKPSNSALHWFDVAGVAQAPVPTPVRKLLQLLGQLPVDHPHRVFGLE